MTIIWGGGGKKGNLSEKKRIFDLLDMGQSAPSPCITFSLFCSYLLLKDDFLLQTDRCMIQNKGTLFTILYDMYLVATHRNKLY